MSILDFNKPNKVNLTAVHNKKYTSDSGIDGTYVPNMSKEDTEKWKAKHIKKGDDPRIEIRKTFRFSNNKGWNIKGDFNVYSQVVIIVRPETSLDYPQLVISGNGKIAMTTDIYIKFQQAILEAQILLK